MVSFGSTAAASAYVLILDSDLSPGHELECDKESSDAEMDGAEWKKITKRQNSGNALLVTYF